MTSHRCLKTSANALLLNTWGLFCKATAGKCFPRAASLPMLTECTGLRSLEATYSPQQEQDGAFGVVSVI